MMTNTLFQKIASSALMFGMFCMMIVVVGCSENAKNSIANSDADEVVVFITPEGEEIEILQSEINNFTVESESYQIMIESMDPFVVKNNNGTYKFDSVGFNQANQVLTSDNTEVYSKLTKSIPIINKQILEERKSPGSTALGAYCNWYWWGKKCCYTGSTAQYYIMVMTMGGPIPVFGWGLATYAAWAGYLTAVYGGFCFNGIWGGGVWLTAP